MRADVVNRLLRLDEQQVDDVVAKVDRVLANLGIAAGTGPAAMLADFSPNDWLVQEVPPGSWRFSTS